MKNYIKELTDLFSKIEVTGTKGETLILDKAIAEAASLIFAQREKGNKMILIGNGGSASIASHISTDLLKNACITAIAINDPSLITCLSNDLGYEYVFAKPIEMLAKKGDVLFSISSSGKSKNILEAVSRARQSGCFLITLTGFDLNNPLKIMGDMNFYVPSHSYGYVEIVHLAICHCIVDKLIIEFLKKSRGAKGSND